MRGVVGVESMLWFVRGRAYEVSCRGWSLVVGCREVGSMLWGGGGRGGLCCGLLGVGCGRGVSMLWVMRGGGEVKDVGSIGRGLGSGGVAWGICSRHVIEREGV